jgi:hypothetical protein
VVRLLLLLIACAAAVIWIEPRWDRSSRALTLRLRSPTELRALAHAGSQTLGRRALEELDERMGPPPVSTGPSAAEPGTEAAAARATRDEDPSERITRSEKQRLDRLIQRESREH